MSKSNFQKFIKKDEKGAKLKEKIRQEKKKARQETKEYFAQKKSQASPSRENIRIDHKSTKRTTAKRTAADLVTKKGTAHKEVPPAISDKETGEMPLNKFIAHAGICSRRDAAELVKSGKVTVNGTVIAEPGHKVTARDDIKVQGKKISARKNLV
jgi:23S rRNA pseudouridine2605 synthase